jgi:putative heme-binding domain-containing protein
LDWQLAGVAGLVSALDRGNLGFAEFQRKAGQPLKPVLSSLAPVFAYARGAVQESSVKDPEKVVAVSLLARLSEQSSQDIDILGGLLGPQNSTEIQDAALARLRRLTDPRVAQVLLKIWRSCGLNQRQAVLNTLFSRPEWIEAVLVALEQGKISPGELGILQQQKLLTQAEPGIRQRANRIFARASSDRKKVINAYQEVARLHGDRLHGRQLFTNNCAICHRLRGEGQGTGPDLGTIGDKPVPELVTAILDPNQAVDPAYTAYTAVTKDDRELTGILVSESPNSISLRLAGGAEEQVLRSNLKQFTSSGRSLMPEGFENGLTPQDLSDVIAFLLNPEP